MYIYSVVDFVNISSVSSLSSSFLSSSFTSLSATWIISQTIYSYAVTSPILQYYRQPWKCVCRYSYLEQNSYHVAAIDQLKYSLKRVDHHPFWHNFIKTCFTKAVNNSGFWNLTPEKKTSIYIASSTRMKGIYFPLSIALIIFLKIRVLQLHFSDRMTPWSIGCKRQVVFGGSE